MLVISFPPIVQHISQVFGEPCSFVPSEPTEKLHYAWAVPQNFDLPIVALGEEPLMGPSEFLYCDQHSLMVADLVCRGNTSTFPHIGRGHLRTLACTSPLYD